MKLLHILLTFTPLTSSLHIPHHLLDGIYIAQPNPHNPNDHIIHHLNTSQPQTHLHRRGHAFWNPDSLLNRLNPKTKTLKETLPIPISKTFCWDTHLFNRSDLHASIDALFIEPLYWVPPEFVKFSIHGSVVTFMCNLGNWNTGSLLEFMEAMYELDDKCGGETGGKVAMRKWHKMYGREVRGEAICRWETDKGGMKNDALEVQKKCGNYVNGVNRYIGRGEECKGGGGSEVWDKLRELFPWYHNKNVDEVVDDGSRLKEFVAQTEKDKKEKKKKGGR